MQIERVEIKSKAPICEILPPLVFLVLYLTYLNDIASKPFFRYLVVNPLVYDSEAKQILQGIPSSQPFFLSPLYPGWLASIYFLTNSSRMAVALINGIFGALSIYLVNVITKQVFGKRASCIASIMAACYWSLYYFCGELMPTALCISAVLASTYCALDKKQTPMRVPLIVLGSLSIGFISHLYPGLKASSPEWHYHGKPIANLAFSLVFMIGVALVFITIFSRRSLVNIRCYSIGGTLAGLSLLLWSGTALHTLLLTFYLIIRRAERLAVIAWLAGLAIPIAASTCHNYAITGQMIPLTTSFGVNLFIGNNPTSDGINPFKFGEGNQVRIEADRQGLSGKARSDFFKQRAIEFIKNNKRAWLRLLGRKALISVSRVEISNNADISERRQCWTLRQLAFVNFGLILPLALVGFALAVTRSEGTWLLLSGYLCFMLTQVILFSCERFRVPGATLLIPLAGYGLVGLFEQARKQPAANLITLATVAGLIAFVSNYDFLSLSKIEFPAIIANKAYVERLDGNFQKASELAWKAIQMDPTNASAYFQLGAIEEHFGNLDKSVGYYLISLRNDPFFMASYNRARRILESLNISPSYLDTYVDEVIAKKDSEKTKTAIETYVERRFGQAKQQ